jgi:predicted Zn-dependent protease
MPRPLRPQTLLKCLAMVLTLSLVLASPARPGYRICVETTGGTGPEIRRAQQCTGSGGHRQSNPKKSLVAMNKAIALRPDGPFHHELRGQILIESRQFAAAMAACARAVNGPPGHALILGSYGRALMTRDQTAKTLQVLEKARARDRRDGLVMRDLAVACARSGNRGMASLITAERHALVGRLEDAEIHATRASGLLPNGPGGWQRAQDVLSAAKAAGQSGAGTGRPKTSVSHT